VFFFKQKTAYEIFTDWSSDVCSSDLAVVVGARSRLLRRLRGRAGRSGAFLLRGLARCGGIGTGTVGVATRLCSLRGLTRRRGCRSEERRVGRGWRSGGPAYHENGRRD